MTKLAKLFLGIMFMLAIVFGIFMILGMLELIVTNYPLAWLPLIAVTIYNIFKAID